MYFAVVKFLLITNPSRPQAQAVRENATLLQVQVQLSRNQRAVVHCSNLSFKFLSLTPHLGSH